MNYINQKGGATGWVIGIIIFILFAGALIFAPTADNLNEEVRVEEETEVVKEEKIKITAPLENEVIESPLAITGEARGFWYFEADFPIVLTDINGNRLATAIATAQGDWMTEEFVPFTAELEFEAPESELGFLIFHRDNPSGLLENQEQKQIPIRFVLQEEEEETTEEEL